MRSHAKAVVAVSAVLLLTLALAANPASAEAPTVSIDAPSEVAYTTAKASGTVDPKDIGTWWSYETSTDGGASWSGFAYQGYAEANTGSQPTPFELTGLQPGTAYELRLVANNSTDPEVISAVESFTTLPVAKPIVSLEPVSGIGGEQASFEGEVNPNAPDADENLSDAAKAAFETTYRFECTPACPNTPGNQTIAADDEPQTVSFDPEGLEPDTAYTVKLFASNAGGEEVAEQSFETNALAPTVAAATVGALTHNSARLAAYVDANNAATTATFEYDDNAGFSSPTTAPSGDGTTITGNGNKVAYADVSGLAPEQDYFWRVSVESAEGSDADTAPRSFAPYPAPVKQTCPNEAIRVEQGSTYLPNCRAWELVSSVGKMTPALAATISPDGSRALYVVSSGTDETTYAGASGKSLATRTATGWRSRSALPAQELLGGNMAFTRAATPDLRRILVETEPTLGQPGSFPLGRYAPESEEYEPAFTLPPELVAMGATLESVVASEDLGRLIYRGRALRPGDPADEVLYDLGSGEPELIGLLPDEEPPACGISRSEFAASHSSSSYQRWVSESGERVMFQTRGNDCSGPSQLYMRDGGVEGVTRLLSGPALTGPETDARFIRATEDGTVVYFTSASRLEPRDANSGEDVYRYEIGAGNRCLTCAVVDAQVVAGQGQFGSPRSVLVAESGERVYFTSRAALAPSAKAGDLSLYVWRETEDEVSFIAPSSGMYTTARVTNAVGSRDASVFAFVSNRPELNALSGSENGGFEQYYRYDDRSGELACVSCPAGGTTGGASVPFGMPGVLLLNSAEPLPADGSSLFFRTPQPLVAQDVNGSLDVYEWHEGEVGLLTDGHSSPGLLKGEMQMSPDGANALFASQEALVPGAIEGPYNIYVARINGGFAQPVPPAPCGGEGCQGALSPPPAAPAPATPTFSGPGDPKAKPCAKGKVRKRGNCVKPRKKARKAKNKRAADKNRGTGK